MNKYEEAGLDEYEILSAHDERTCPICSKMNGKHFKLSEAEAGVNYPPLHSNCRCAVLGVIK
jgi:SPP1 gp7 family putative phage head morphogenesis protein